MPRGGKCDHRNCDGGPCKQLTDEELEPAEKDIATAQALIDEGWLSVSTRHRLVAKATDAMPTAEQLIRPEMFPTEFGGKLAEMWHYERIHLLRMLASGNTVGKDRGLVESKELTLREFRAFKKLGGSSA